MRRDGGPEGIHAWFKSLSISRRRTGNLAWTMSHTEALINIRIAVNQDVAEGNDAAVLTDARHDFFVQPGELRQRFADNLELPLDGGAQHGIGAIIVKRLPGREVHDPRRRLLDIIKILFRLKRHTGALWCARRTGGSRDF